MFFKELIEATRHYKSDQLSSIEESTRKHRFLEFLLRWRELLLLICLTLILLLAFCSFASLVALGTINVGFLPFLPMACMVMASHLPFFTLGYVFCMSLTVFSLWVVVTLGAELFYPGIITQDLFKDFFTNITSMHTKKPYERNGLDIFNPFYYAIAILRGLDSFLCAGISWLFNSDPDEPKKIPKLLRILISLTFKSVIIPLFLAYELFNLFIIGPCYAIHCLYQALTKPAKPEDLGGLELGSNEATPPQLPHAPAVMPLPSLASLLLPTEIGKSGELQAQR